MKITCSYCDSLFNDTLEKCPNCGAPNDAVRRSADGQPLTVEELKQWYIDRGLPPYEVTRFFIGEDCRERRAFGIYKDENTGNFVVYKNKDSGERAVRYEGTDEAFAVNELYQRLKQEILQQKARNGGKGAAGKGAASGSPVKKILLWVALGLALLNGSCLGIMGLFTLTLPKVGYYAIGETYYYNSPLSYAGSTWFSQGSEDADWNCVKDSFRLPAVLQGRSSAKKYYLGEACESAMGCRNFEDSACYKDLEVGLYCKEGYYALEDGRYYHLDGRCTERWYLYDGASWRELSYEEIPYELKHSSLNGPFFAGADFGDAEGCTDFAETLAYKDDRAPKLIKTGYYRVDDRVYYHNADLYSAGWYLFDGDWAKTDTLPEELVHPSTVQDFFYTDTWDQSTQVTDFSDSKAAKDAKSNSSSDSSYDWDSGSSWDSGSTDWGSDW